MKKRLPAALLAMSLTLSLLTTAALAAGHSFVRTSEDPEDDWVCSDCGGVITADLKGGYDAALSQDGKRLPADVEQTERDIRTYLDELTQNTLDRAGWYVGTVNKISYTAPDGGRDGEYRYSVTVQSYGRSGNPLLTEVTTPAMTLAVPDRSEYSDSGKGITDWVTPGYVQPGSTIYPYGPNYGGSTSSNQNVEKGPAVQRRENLAKLLWYAWISRKHSTMAFTDVPRESWFYSGVSYVWFNDLMSGVSEDRFAPDELTNRAMVWTVLARMGGAGVSPGEGQEWYERGMAWAVQRGLTDGASPMSPITREELADVLWRCAGGPITPADLSGFSDRGSVSGYALNGVCWCVANGVLQGTDGRLSPQGSVTRAELAVMIMRYGSVPRA